MCKLIVKIGYGEQCMCDYSLRNNIYVSPNEVQNYRIINGCFMKI